MTTYSLLIFVFYANYKREIVFVLTCRTGRTILGLQHEHNSRINKELVLKFWINWRNWWSFSYSFLLCKTLILVNMYKARRILLEKLFRSIVLRQKVNLDVKSCWGASWHVDTSKLKALQLLLFWTELCAI